MKQSLGLTVSLALICRFVTCDQQHMVCKTIQDVFSDNEDSDSSSRIHRLPGIPGKIGPRGIPGLKGESGPPGRPAVVDYNRIDELIEEKVALAIAELESRTKATTAQGTSRNPEPTTSSGLLSCNSEGGLYYRQICYTIPHLSSSRDMDYNEAVAECAKSGALLVEIHDRSQQDAVYAFAVTKIPARHSISHIWVGMEYQSSTSTLLYRSGKRTSSSQLRWFPIYPSSGSLHKYLILKVRNDGSSSFGLWNYYDPVYRTHGVLCEKQV